MPIHVVPIFAGSARKSGFSEIPGLDMLVVLDEGM
jgi:hypothetical protein